MDNKKISINAAAAAIEKEPLRQAYGFKGGSLSELWQSAVQLKSENGSSGLGVGTQSVLWSDAAVFSRFGEAGGNELMYSLTRHAAHQAQGQTFATPLELLDCLFDELTEYGKKLSGMQRLRKTFVLNALVGLDNAAWLLYAREKGLKNFDELLPEFARSSLSQRHREITCIPVIGYGAAPDEIKQLATEGYFFIKVKIGHPGTQQEMLEKDKAHLKAVHRQLGDVPTSRTESGKILYYLDANGRYESKDTLRRLLDYAREIGAAPQIAIVEEPFPETSEEDVSGLGFRIAADESAHTAADTKARIQMGYSAIALKPVAKTLSMSLRIAECAQAHEVPCFCADLTANPVLLEWNKNVAARLDPFPGLKTGLLETNGHQHYLHWDRLRSYHPLAGASWTQRKKGMFELDEAYYKSSGGIFGALPHYLELFTPEKGGTRTSDAASAAAGDSDSASAASGGSDKNN